MGGCWQVRANDLNPASHKYLEENVCLNKVAAAVRASCLDGRAFIRQMCRGWTLPGQHQAAEVWQQAIAQKASSLSVRAPQLQAAYKPQTLPAWVACCFSLEAALPVEAHPPCLWGCRRSKGLVP